MKNQRRKRNSKTKEKKNEETGVRLDLAEFDEAQKTTIAEESADVEGNTGEKPKRRKRNSKTKEKKNEETGVILDLAEFDEAQKSTIAEESADVEGNTGEKPKRRKRNSKTKEKKNEETGVILDLAEFDEAQKTTIAEEMRRDLKKIVENNMKIEKSMEIMQRSMKEMIEKEQMMQRRMEEMIEKEQIMQRSMEEMKEQMMQLQPAYSQPISDILNFPQLPSFNFGETEPQMSPVMLTASTPGPASFEKTTESPMMLAASTPTSLPLQKESPVMFTTPIPITKVSSKFTELPSSEINKQQLQSIHDVLEKHTALRTECKLGVLAVKLAREAIFGDPILRRCTPRGWNDTPALPQAELNLLKTILFEQFPRFWSCPEEYEKNGLLPKKQLLKPVRGLGRNCELTVFDSNLHFIMYSFN